MRVQKLTVFLLFVLSSSKFIYAQSDDASTFSQSPTAAGIGVYGNTDITPFTGLANIGVKVFSLKEGDIPVNAELKYFSGGMKSSDHAGWTGLGWSLEVGGVVTRKVNGVVDEIADSYLGASTSTDSYLYNYGIYNNDNWYTTDYLSNTIYMNPYYWVLKPDEFFFTLPSGSSGSFFLNHLGQWVVKSNNSASLKVSVSINSSPYVLTNVNTNATITLTRIIYTIVIVDQEGFTYTFGNVPEAIEFTRSARNPNLTTTVNNEDVIASTWYLTKIQSPKGNVVNYQYQRKENLYNQQTSYPQQSNATMTSALQSLLGAPNNSQGTSVSPASTYGEVITPSYLKQISSKSFTVNFSISQATQLQYAYTNVAFQGFTYPDLEIQNTQNATQAQLTAISKWYKLDNITIYDMNNSLAEKYALTYNNDPNDRLFLMSFGRVDKFDGQTPPYVFTYNPVKLPAYNAMEDDKWGYYNNHQFPYPTYPALINATTLSNYFAMDPNYALAGTLSTINYPTGGSTSIFYEPNDYSMALDNSGTGVNLLQQTGMGGGLRVNKIIDYDTYGNSYIRQYKYVFSSVAGTPSSGVMTLNKKEYHNFTIGSPTMAQYQFFISTDLQFLDYTKGRPVLYSEVKEIEPDNSYIIYKYSNSDNLNYRDESPLNIYTFFFGEYFTGASENDRKAASSNSNPFLSPTSRDLERGLLLSKEVHNASGTLLTNTVNTYNSDPNRFNSYVRSFNNYLLQPNLGAVTAIEYYFQAYKIYTYFPYLAQRVEYTYDQQNPLATPVTKTTNYTYDPVTMLLTQKTTTDSRGGVISDTYKHPTDFSGTAIYNTMVSNNMLAPVVETDEQVGGALTKKSFTNFQSWTASSATIIAPVSMQQQVLTNPTETLMEFNSYDGYGNVKEEQKPGDARHAYIWDYQSDYPVAQAVNASASDIAYTSFEADGTGNWQGVNVSAIQYPNATSPPTGRNYYNLVTGNTISSATLNSQVQYLVSYWSNNGQCTVSNTQSVKVVSTINGWTYYEHLIATGATSVAISFSGTCGIDELRLYPANALMTTYTYSPLVGMTSKCDPSGRITYYAYDGVNRLKTIRDQNGNIIKEICYSVGGLPDNCSETVSYNDPQSGTYYSHSCQPYYVAQPYVYAVKSRSYFSLISPADANQQAMNDVTANGQNMANQYGACSPPPMLNITYYNYSTAAATLRLTNTVTNAVYSFSLNANQTASMATAGQIPAGSYNVTLMRNRGSQTGTVEFDGYIQTNVSTLTLTGISITAENDPMAIVN